MNDIDDNFPKSHKWVTVFGNGPIKICGRQFVEDNLWKTISAILWDS